MMKRWTVVALVVVTMAGCGSDDEEPVSIRERCDDVSYAVEGRFVVDGDAELSFPFASSGPLSESYIRSGAIQLSIGDVERADDAPGLILRFRENEGMSDLLDQLANATSDGPLILGIADGSTIPSDAPRRSDLTLVECGIASGTFCAQLALDTTDDGAIGDDDEKVFAATGGEIRVVEVDNGRSRLRLDFAVELGTNVLTTGDASFGEVSGCINARYDSAGGGASGWTLE